jgi:hypothetical protein
MAAGIWQVLQVLAAAGAVQHDELVRTAQESFKNLSTNPITAGELVKKEPAFFTGSEVSSRVTFLSCDVSSKIMHSNFSVFFQQCVNYVGWFISISQYHVASQCYQKLEIIH